MTELCRVQCTIGGKESPVYTFVLRSDGSVIRAVNYGAGHREGYKQAGLKYPAQAMQRVREDPKRFLLASLAKRGYEAVR